MRRASVQNTNMMNARFVIDSTNGKLLSGSAGREFAGVCTDSRIIGSGELFVALRGENHDGHKFICDAIKGGAAGVLSEDECAKNKSSDSPYIKVESTLDSLGDLAKCYRESFAGLKVIAITGSNGKTTTKEMISYVLACGFNVHKNTGNFNNLIGLPLTIFKLRQEHEAAVLELGMNQFGEIRRLAEICSPDIGVITNIGKAHIGNLGGIDGVKKAKGELVENFGPQKTFIVNADDPRVVDIASKLDCKNITYSLKGGADVTAEEIQRQGMDAIRFTLCVGGKRKDLKLQNIGIHNVSNALCAAACGVAMNIGIGDIADALSSFEFPKMRLQILDAPQGFKVINDCYNANPDSMKNAVDELSEFSGVKKIAVLADMLELGDDAEKEHELIGSHIAAKNINYLFTYGALGKHIYKGAGGKVAGGAFDDYGEIAEKIIKTAGPGDIVLVKGSRGMKMENLIKFIMERGGD